MRQSLKRHHTPCLAVTHVDVDVARPRAGVLLVSYVVTGRIGDLRLPPAAAPARADELWRQTCFEAFIRPLPGEAYYEFNFSPSMQWAAYRFDSYRSGMRVANEIDAPRIDAQTAPDRYALQAAVNLSRLPRDGAWRIGLAAVIVDTNGPTSYWAPAHPPGQPDFHHSDCFAWEIS